MALLLLSAAAAAAATTPAVDEVSVDVSAPPELSSFVKFWQASVGSGHGALGVPGAIAPGPVPVLRQGVPPLSGREERRSVLRRELIDVLIQL